MPSGVVGFNDCVIIIILNTNIFDSSLATSSEVLENKTERRGGPCWVVCAEESRAAPEAQTVPIQGAQCGPRPPAEMPVTAARLINTQRVVLSLLYRRVTQRLKGLRGEEMQKEECKSEGELVISPPYLSHPQGIKKTFEGSAWLLGFS